ncbi:hypothetical protein [Aurantimonas coralicida]|uniref:hypothetical protein n=1 Tax=Aurantimonas coralicida TaxID=182270 RepID=UPI001D19459C|nr:hypothetical protein [Aurantimonas coralicida]MCC4300250.1 hypothetical protein [Aurantimonas coralicida]
MNHPHEIAAPGDDADADGAGLALRDHLRRQKRRNNVFLVVLILLVAYIFSLSFGHTESATMIPAGNTAST